METNKQTYSFSRLDSWNQCPLQWKYNYLDKLPQLSNFFSELGSYMHLLLEAYDRGKIPADRLSEVFDKHYRRRVHTPPPFPIEDKWKSEVYWEFNKFRGFSKPAIGIERDILIDYGDFFLRGFIDREVEGGIIDYKVSKPFDKKKLEHKKKQLYLYSRAYKEKWGKYPEKLYFFFFRVGKITEIDFDIKDYNKAVKWARNMVKEIESATEYPAKIDKGFCNNLCGFRNICTDKNA